MLFPREQLLTSASDTINNNRSIGNDSQLLTNPFSSAPYQSSNDFINTLIQNVFSDLTLQSLPPEEILFGKLPIRSNSNSNQSSSSSSIFQLNTDEIFGPNNTVSNQSISSIPKEFSTTPSITNSNNYQPNPPFNITPSPISISDNWRYPPIPPRYEAGVQYSEPDEPMLGLERDAYNVDLTRLSSTIGRQASNRISDNPTTTTIVSDNFNNRLNPTTIPINNFDSPSLPSTRSTEIPDLRRVLNRTLSNTSRAPNLVLHEQYSDVDSNPKRTQINSYEFPNLNNSSKSRSNGKLPATPALTNRRKVLAERLARQKLKLKSSNRIEKNDINEDNVSENGDCKESNPKKKSSNDNQKNENEIKNEKKNDSKSQKSNFVKQPSPLSNDRKIEIEVPKSKNFSIGPPPEFWRKHNKIVDDIMVTDVTTNDSTITVRECRTPQGFFKERTEMKSIAVSTIDNSTETVPSK
ncbi:hypothetical protein QR98_0089090 [Sarcoptes scabiei]|uniref:Uncharacterized protein n=1 Tax=Sarcoptes scabiei TaxID=52283 RepID=A0A132AH85_SARSC|nr:hypothetical protein QR98_0089090 [Sarcoptes scabiei]